MSKVITVHIRRIDGSGRVIVPKELCTKLNFKDGDYLQFTLWKDGIVIKKCLVEDE